MVGAVVKDPPRIPLACPPSAGIEKLDETPGKLRSGLCNASSLGVGLHQPGSRIQVANTGIKMNGESPSYPPQTHCPLLYFSHPLLPLPCPSLKGRLCDCLPPTRSQLLYPPKRSSSNHSRLSKPKQNGRHLQDRRHRRRVVCFVRPWVGALESPRSLQCHYPAFPCSADCPWTPP